MRKICVITGSRAEYGLLYHLIKAIDNDVDLQLQLVATGMHLSPEFGLTYQEIEKDFIIDKKVEMLLSADSEVAIAKSMGLATIGFADALNELEPDVMVLLGDRYEILAAAQAAMVANIPIAHIHGGEVTEGVIDEAIRHSITKMSHLHFVATEVYQKRVVQLGEHPDRVLVVGGLGIESIEKMKLLSKSEFEKSINFKLAKRNILIAFHPTTLEYTKVSVQFSGLLSVVDVLKDTHIIFTKANSDTGGRIINQMIGDYVAKNPQKSIAFISLGQLRYLSAMKYVDAIVGNSSSGIIEAPSFKIGTINVGDRQKGRIKADSIIDCSSDKMHIEHAFEQLYSRTFQKRLATVKNPYSNGKTSRNIKNILKKNSLQNILKKSFYDINFTIQNKSNK